MKKLIFSDNPSVIEWSVQEALSEGWDLCAAPFVLAGHFCQWVEREESIHEYKLVSAFLPSDFEQQVLNLHADGWDLYTKPVDWNGAIFQWMRRLQRDGAVKVENASAITLAGLQLVESVQSLGRFSFLDFSSRGAS